ncbi:hypothetical protein NEOLEDRAFT_1177436 [Neolentinus lepideus HHB14362 ss-1]|uniref:Cyclin-D1-binding protein 1-like C-terminal domain-containing protein n=1 Tax=Neolentinus lepideus HHB14362 ss-1 TaxID=1314782 RepID=A0A165TBK8_9AGAM|nr:hypothetical protein NEOLEDRAFT_1177436 [Neolentinus lepideus HHB14362 ss-1]
MAQSSDKQKAVLALSIASQTCTTALSALASPRSLSSNYFTDTPSSTSTPPPLETLHADLLSILQMTSHSITKLALVLKPSGPPVYSVSVPVLTDLTSQISDLAGCAETFGLYRATYGEYLVKEVTQLVEDVVYNARSLLQAYLHLASDSTGRRIMSAPRVPGLMNAEDFLIGSSKEEYLKLTGTIHELVDGATGASPTLLSESTKSAGKNKATSPGLSKNNVEAVKKLWMIDGGSVRDGVRELKEMIEDSNDDGADKDEGFGADEDEDNGWAELGIGNSKLKKDEVECAKQVLPLLNLTTTLHIHLPTLFTRPTPSSSSSPLAPSLPNSTLSLLPPLSSSLLSTSDDLIATLYSPQNSASISQCIRALVRVVKELEGVFTPIHGLEGKMAELKINEGEQEGGGGEENKERKKREVLMGMFGRIYKVAETLLERLGT